jgi:hypothetical protein
MSQYRMENVPGGRAEARAFVVFLCCLAALAIAGCATRKVTVKANDPLYGTWVNRDVDEGKERGYAKSVMTPDGRELFYRHIADTEPAVEGAFTIEEAWIDRQGYRWYKISESYWPFGADGATKGKMFSLVKISPDGNTIESAGQETGYPDKVEPVTSPMYSIAHRQK